MNGHFRSTSKAQFLTHSSKSACLSWRCSIECNSFHLFLLFSLFRLVFTFSFTCCSATVNGFAVVFGRMKMAQRKKKQLLKLSHRHAIMLHQLSLGSLQTNEIRAANTLKHMNKKTWKKPKYGTDQSKLHRSYAALMWPKWKKKFYCLIPLEKIMNDWIKGFAFSHFFLLNNTSLACQPQRKHSVAVSLSLIYIDLNTKRSIHSYSMPCFTTNTHQSHAFDTRHRISFALPGLCV